MAPLTVTPPPSAVASLDPLELMVTLPEVPVVGSNIVTCVRLSTLTIVAAPPNAGLPVCTLVIVSVCPASKPVVVLVPMKVTVALPLVRVTVNPVTAATLANSIFLSSMVTVLELIVVTVPLTVRSPPMVTAPAKLILPVLLIVNLSVIVSALAPLDPALAVRNMMLPEPPEPVPLPASITVFAPVIFVPTAAPPLSVATPPALEVVPSPPLNTPSPPAPVVEPPAPPVTVTIAPALDAPVVPVVTVRVPVPLDLIVVLVLLAPTSSEVPLAFNTVPLDPAV